MSKIEPYFNEKNFRLYQGDCLDIMKMIPDETFDMVFADPPYMLSNDGFTCQNGQMVSVNKGKRDTSKGIENDLLFHELRLTQCKRVLKSNGTLWVSGTYHSIYQCGYLIQKLNYHMLNDISWFKPNASPNLSCRMFTASHESLIWARKDKKAKHYFDYDSMKNGDFPNDGIKKPGLQMRSVWSINPPKPIEKIYGKHPTQKPLDLLLRIIKASTGENAMILDPFNGGGTTGIATIKLGGNRKYVGIDMEKEYLDLSIKRYKDLI